jgi:hypothetical protein
MHRRLMRALLCLSTLLAVLALVLACISDVQAQSKTTCPPVKRSTTVLRQFRKSTICPATGKIEPRSCPGYVIDHKEPLCKVGKAGDVLSNLRYQEYFASLITDMNERAECQKLNRCTHHGD